MTDFKNYPAFSAPKKAHFNWAIVAEVAKLIIIFAMFYIVFAVLAVCEPPPSSHKGKEVIGNVSLPEIEFAWSESKP
jgi:hypothetical protein